MAKRIQRFRCLECGRCFSTQTFAPTYFLKRPDLLARLVKLVQSCAGYRQMADILGVAHSTIAGQVARLGRHCFLENELRRPAAPPAEDLVLDGFVTFEYSQFWPFHVHTLVGADSYFIHDFTESEVRRSGSMTVKQKEKRAQLEKRYGRPDPTTVVRDVEQVFRVLAPEPAELVVRSDEHKAYPKAIARLKHLRIQHRTTSSRRPRTPSNPLFAINQLHAQIRHRGADQKRETIAFVKKRQSAVARLAILLVGRNYMRSRTVNRPQEASPAEFLGLIDRKLTVRDLLSRRHFPTRMTLPEHVGRYYWGRLETRQIPNGRRHELKLAF